MDKRLFPTGELCQSWMQPSRHQIIPLSGGSKNSFSPSQSTRPVPSSAELVKNHPYEEYGNVRDSRVHEPLCAHICTGTIGPQPDLQKDHPQNECPKEVVNAGHANHRRKGADPHQDGGRADDLAECRIAARINDWKHPDSGPRVVLSVHPRDGQEMRELPEQKNGKQNTG